MQVLETVEGAKGKPDEAAGLFVQLRATCFHMSSAFQFRQYTGSCGSSASNSRTWQRFGCTLQAAQISSHLAPQKTLS